MDCFLILIHPDIYIYITNTTDTYTLITKKILILNLGAYQATVHTMAVINRPL